MTQLCWTDYIQFSGYALLVNKNCIVVYYTEWPKSHFTNSSVYILTAVFGDLCATLYGYVSYKRLPALLKYNALLFLPVLIRNYVTLCTTYSGLGRDSSVGIATRYGLDGPEIESRWGRDFPHLSRPALEPISSSYTMGSGSFPGVKRPGRCIDHPPLASAEVKERVQLYLYSPSGSSWLVLE